MKIEIRSWNEEDGTVTTVKSQWTRYPKFAELYGRVLCQRYNNQALCDHDGHHVYFYRII